ncbi:ROK family protein [Parapedobacter indicus]|uniref:Glucokinase n=1 Tax=Parapedobacter indicus TaxID=1477437 RepID=A0A1I3EUS0_9SPHI|nr:ROK family protein [Parapedobacter indicus]PPL03422.1 glucokinase [Parapedobacter indicus]SFI02734.1 glucokinase [Parapedobacter indicus]
MTQQDNPLVIASDIGGTHITAALVDICQWQVSNESTTRQSVNSHADAKSILSAWAAPFKEVIASHPTLVSPVIGIAMPGPFDYENGISRMRDQDKYDNLYGMDIRRELAERIGVDGMNIRFINDAAAFLQGEVFAGKHNGHAKMLGITLGTGLGSAVWEKGNNAVDADLWKTPYLDSNMEEHLVTRWFVRRTAQHDVNVTGLRELLQLRGQHAFVEDILAEYSHHLLQFLTFFSQKEKTDKFIIGGNISRAWDIFKGFNPEAFAQFDIHISQLGEDAALIGAAALFAS